MSILIDTFPTVAHSLFFFSFLSFPYFFLYSFIINITIFSLSYDYNFVLPCFCLVPGPGAGMDPSFTSERPSGHRCWRSSSTRGPRLGEYTFSFRNLYSFGRGEFFFNAV